MWANSHGTYPKDNMKDIKIPTIEQLLVQLIDREISQKAGVTPKASNSNSSNSSNQARSFGAKYSKAEGRSGSDRGKKNT